MTELEKKDYIKRIWGVSSGKKITEILKRYWSSQKDINGADIVQKAEEIFGVSSI